MTDATVGRGGVGIRLYVSGGEVVKRTFDQVGDSGKKMWAQIAMGDKAANPAIRALSTGVGELKAGVSGLAMQAGSAGSVLSAFGATGVAAAAGLGALAIGLNRAREAMSFAAELTDTADRIGVGVEELQAWSFVADEAGVSTQSLQANLEKLNGVLGAFKSGIGDAKLKPVFEELGITQEQLAQVQTADELMLILADTLGQVRDRALQVKFARSLGVEESLPILRLGADGIRNLSDEAERLGLIVGKDVVQALDAADREMEIAQQRIDTSVRLSVAGLADDFADVVGAIASAIVWLQRLDDKLKSISLDLPGRSANQMFSDFARGRSGAEGDAIRRRDAAERSASSDQGQDLRRNLGELAAGTGAYGATPGFDPRGHSSGGGRAGGGASRAAAEAERRQRERERSLDQLQRAELDAQRAALQARYGPGGTEESATELALATVTIELEAQIAAREALRAQLEKAGALDAEAQLRLDQLKQAQEENAAARDAAILEEERRDLAAERLREEEVAERDAIALLDIQAQMVGTARERYEIGRRILLAEQALERKLLEAEVGADGRVTSAERRQLGRLQERQAAEVSLFDFDEQERLRDQFNGYGREVVQAIEDGRIGEYIGDRIKERLLDGALNALFSAIGGGGGGKSGGGFLGGLLGFGASLLSGGKSPIKIGKAAGGDVRDGLVYRMAEHGPELLLLGGKGQVTSAAETAKMVQDLAVPGGGGGVSVSAVYAPNISVNGSGPEIDALRRQLAEEKGNFRSNVVEAVAEAQTRRIL